jgi:ubiquinone/menaquinone biosynthesis C-methylase UbiE
MNVYSRYIFPCVLDWAMNRPAMEAQRPIALAPARGDVLEIGLGTGRNLRHYGPDVRHIFALEPNTGMARRARARIEAARVPVSYLNYTADGRIDAPDARFDTVVSTWTLCSVANIDRTLAEVRRVLKPGGLFLFIEHGLAPDEGVARWQHRLNPINRVIGDGCNLDRPIVERVEAAGLGRFETLEQFYMPDVPRIGGFTTRGVAVR